jgi:hypothetical protein
MALAGRPRGRRLAVETTRKMGRAQRNPSGLSPHMRNDDGFRCALPILRSRGALTNKVGQATCPPQRGA